MIDFLSELARRRREDHIRTAAQRAQATARELQAELENLEERLDRLTLACMALWSLVQERGGLKDEDLLQRVRAIDLADGRLDGKAARGEALKCGKCGRIMSARHGKCVYCGADKLAKTAFDPG